MATRNIPAPPQPPRLKAPVERSAQFAAVVANVNDPTNPTVCSVFEDNLFPAITGIVIPANLGLNWAPAPNPPAVPPQGTVYYENPTTNTGGSWVMVDRARKQIINVSGGISTSAPFDYSSLFQYIKHTGAYDSTHKYQNPGTVDITQLTKRPVTVIAPILASAVTGPIYLNPGTNNGAYDAEVSFTLTVTNPIWLGAVTLWARVAAASPGSATSSVGMLFKGDVPPTSNGAYSIVFPALAAGTSYDLYITFEDIAAYDSNVLYLATTNANSLTFFNGPGFPGGTATPNISSQGTLTYPIIGAGSYVAQIASFQLSNGSNTSLGSSIAEIALLAQEYDPIGGALVAGSVPKVVNKILPNGSGIYTADFPTLISNRVYQLSLQYISFRGEASAITTFSTNANGLSHPGSLPKMPIPTVPNATVTLSQVDSNTVGHTIYTWNLSCSTDTVGTTIHTVAGIPTGSLWLYRVELRAVVAGTSPTDVTGAIHNTHVSSVPGNSIGNYDFYLGNLAANISYDFYLFYVDYQGTVSSPSVLLGTTTAGSFLNKIPGGTTISASGTLHGFGTPNVANTAVPVGVDLSITINSGAGNVGDWLFSLPKYKSITAANNWTPNNGELLEQALAHPTGWFGSSTPSAVDFNHPSVTFSAPNTIFELELGGIFDIALGLKSQSGDSLPPVQVSIAAIDVNNGAHIRHTLHSQTVVNRSGLTMSTQGQMPYFNGTTLVVPSIIFIQLPSTNQYCYVNAASYGSVTSDNLAIYASFSAGSAVSLNSISISSGSYDATIQNPLNVVVGFTRWDGASLWFSPNGWNNSDHASAIAPFKPVNGFFTTGTGFKKQGSMMPSASNFVLNLGTLNSSGGFTSSWSAWTLVYTDGSIDYGSAYSFTGPDPTGVTSGGSAYATCYFNVGTIGNISTIYSAGQMSQSQIAAAIGDGKVVLVVNQLLGTVPTSGSSSTSSAGSGGSGGGYGRVGGNGGRPQA